MENIYTVQENTYLQSVGIYSGNKICVEVSVTEARASTPGHWCVQGLPWMKTAPGCHKGGRCSGWGMDEWWRDAAGGTKQERTPELWHARGRKFGSGAQEALEKPWLHHQCFPHTPCSCCQWTGRPSAGRTSCLHGRCADRHTSASVVSRARDPSAPSPSSGNGPHSPESLPFPPLGSSGSNGSKVSI